MRRWLACAALVLALAASGCGRQEGPRSPVLAQVNGEPITQADLDVEKRLKHGAQEEGLLEELIDRRLMLQQARRLGIRPGQAEMEALVREASSGYAQADLKGSLAAQGILPEDWQESLRQQWTISRLVEMEIGRHSTVSDQEIKDYYWEHLGDFSAREKRHLRQIVTSRPEDARKAMQELSLGDDFSQVAARLSVAPEAASGGDLGWVSSNALPAALAAEAFKLKKGAVGGPVQSPWGYHLLKVEGIQPAGRISLAAARPGIRETLTGIKQQAPYQAWLMSLRRDAVVTRSDEKQAP